jgi:hypothetical protein
MKIPFILLIVLAVASCEVPTEGSNGVVGTATMAPRLDYTQLTFFGGVIAAVISAGWAVFLRISDTSGPPEFDLGESKDTDNSTKLISELCEHDFILKSEWDLYNRRVNMAKYVALTSWLVVLATLLVGSVTWLFKIENSLGSILVGISFYATPFSVWRQSIWREAKREFDQEYQKLKIKRVIDRLPDLATEIQARSIYQYYLQKDLKELSKRVLKSRGTIVIASVVSCLFILTFVFEQFSPGSFFNGAPANSNTSFGLLVLFSICLAWGGRRYFRLKHELKELQSKETELNSFPVV